LEHAKTAASIALDPHEPLALTPLEQIHQPAESVAALVEPALGLPQNLFHVAEIHRPPCVPGSGQDAPGDADAFGVVADLRRHVHRRRPDLVSRPRSVGVRGSRQEAVSRWGEPNGYILGEEGSGAFVGGLRYGLKWYGAPYELRALNRVLQYQRPETTGF
jgi:hypothetical protein